MITVEELIIQSLYYRLVVTRIRRDSTTPAASTEPANEASGTTAGTPKSYNDVDATGSRAATGGAVCLRDGSLPVDVSVSVAPPLQTVLDTGEVLLCRRTVVSCETQTSWSCLANGDVSLSTSTQMDFLGGIPMILGSQPVIDVSGVDDVSVVQLQQMGDNEQRIVAMFSHQEDSRQKELISNEPRATITDGEGDNSESLSATPPARQSSTEAAHNWSTDHEMDSGIWDVVSGRDSRNTTMDLSQDLRQAVSGWPCESTPLSCPVARGGQKDDGASSTEVDTNDAQVKRKLTYKVFNVNDVASLSEGATCEPARGREIVWQSPEHRHSLIRTVHSGSVTSIKYEAELDAHHSSSIKSLARLCTNNAEEKTAPFGHPSTSNDVAGHQAAASVGTVTNDVAGYRGLPTIDFDAKRQPFQNEAIATLLSIMVNENRHSDEQQLRCRSDETLSRRQAKMADSPGGSDEASSVFSYDMSFDSKFDTSTESLVTALASEAAEEYIRYPDWMGELSPVLKALPLTQLAIPGSHISLSVERHMHTDMDFSKCDYDMADFLRKLPDLSVFNDFRSLMKRVWKAWMPKQWLSIGEQLAAGVRYFDVKVCTYRSAFYGEHGLYSRCLARYMREMRTFLDAHPQEVAILHFQRLSQLEKSEKRRLVTSLFQIFGAKMAKSVVLACTSLADMRRHRKQVIVIFNHADLDDLANHIFAGLIWSDQLVDGTLATSRSVSELIPHLDATYSGEMASRDHGRLHVTRAVLCPDMSMVFGEFQHRSMHDLTSRETTPALARWLQCRPLLNVVTVDFAGMADIVGIIIRLNHAKKTVTDV